MTERTPDTSRPRVALIQTFWDPDPEVNLARTLALLDTVQDVQLIILPEFFLGPPFYFPGRAHLKGVIDQPVPGPVLDRLAEVARAKGSYLLCGTVVEREGEGEDTRYYNTAVLLDDQGRIAAKARKTHRFAAEMVTVEPSDELVVVDTPFGRLGICVCSDFWIPEVPRTLAMRGAEIIAVPGAALRGNIGITRPCIQANSSFNVCYTLLAGAVGEVTGERAGRQVSISVAGHSTVAAPERLLGSLDEEEGVLYAELDLDRVRELREVDLSFRNSLYFCLHGRRPELYQELLKPYAGHQDLATLITDYLTSHGS
ncbi:carbon-nitrogen hydrolase family protein [Kitasatospora brasiliensis]|uniref:carbon-nitrogen hydrolase family protein n=1 Tax=Kitasatospora brasiliensis TaxID=3058040 RepID=UPI00292EA829|nr:carbon-nitrogen hydrolase family protein [Kitasatospora sp. K002]